MNSASDQIYFDIQSKIISGELKSGDKLPSENDMCKLWNTSRVSVRKALERLVAIGVLYKRKGGGTYISELDASMYFTSLLPFILFRKENMIDILEFRKIIEVGAVRLCAQRRNDNTIKKLHELLDEMEEYKDDRERFPYTDLQFHLEIAKGTDNAVIVKINNILISLLETHQKSLNKVLGPSGGLNDHKNILIAIEDKNPELGAHFMEMHIVRTINDIKKAQDIKAED
ncbi:FadR/GntR family transcriptional regulator [Petroclostridium sp. X23]|uniref:FadR/GntR family transcriptional regulator n=1 Tax=Petroclostridium sp. X23 TaxID=3045146 RepID=UPI0024AD7D51|nr:FadR/GntR family transcriptional regulator [Petroclostridium sp. X23]WHH59391.1 FadR/GntR family transcriptional regulator [Petroclostridium sp. X23]